MVAASLIKFGNKMAFHISSLHFPLGISFDELCRYPPLLQYSDECAEHRRNKIEITVGCDFLNL
jgi:hypothetical protein